MTLLGTRNVKNSPDVPKVGHGPKMGQNECDCACVSVVFTIIPVVFYSTYIKPEGY